MKFNALILFFVLGSPAVRSFVPRSPSILRTFSLSNGTDNPDEERKIQAAYFLQSSGFAPSNSIISTLLDNESTDVSAIQSMTTLEQSRREALLSRLSIADEDYADHIQETKDEWDEEWKFRQSASVSAGKKIKVKQQERLDAFLMMMEGRSAVKAKASVDGRLTFGMPYGEKQPKKKQDNELQVSEPVSEIKEETSTPILTKIMEEKDIEQPVLSQSSEITTAITESSNDAEVVMPAPALTVIEQSTTIDEVAEKEKPLDNLILVQDSGNTESKKVEEPIEVIEPTEAEKAAAEQRAANAKAAQEKADEKARRKQEAEAKKKEEAKAKAEAILNHAEEEERLRMEKEQAEAEQYKLILEAKEAEELKLKEEAKAQAELEAAAAEEEMRLKREREEEEAAMLKAEEEEQARLHAEANQQRINMVESKMQSLTDGATKVTFDAKLDNDLYLVGVGVRKKAIINVYSVAMYSSPSVLEAVSVFKKGQKEEAQTALRDAARSFDVSSPLTSFVLEMTFKADGKTIAGAIADSVKPRYGGSDDNVKELESLIFEGVKSKGGQASKGTIFRFDCSASGVTVIVDGDEQGEVECETLGSAFVDVFLDDKAVSPKLVESCVNTWSESGL